MPPVTLAALSLLVALPGVQDPSPEFRLVGQFQQVRVSEATGEPHCYGHTLTLWEHRGALLGLLDEHGGLCGDPPCGALQNVRFDRGTGQLSFSATMAAGRFEFNGTLRRDEVRGTLNGKPVRLARDTDRPPGLDSLRSPLVPVLAERSAMPGCRG